MEITTQERTQQDNILYLIDKSKLSDRTKELYSNAITRALNTGIKLYNASELLSYAETISKTEKSFLKAAIGIVSKETRKNLQLNATPDNLAKTQSTLLNLEGLQQVLQVEQIKGNATHTWLSAKEVIQLFNASDKLNDKVLLILTVGLGLRRDEAIRAEFQDIIKQGDRYTLSVIGKGKKSRSVPIKNEFHRVLMAWQDEIGEGYILRSVNNKNEIGDRLTANGLYKRIKWLGSKIDQPDLSPHDLRRTFARLGYDAGISLEQISMTLGHESIETTRLYLNLEIDTNVCVSDCIPMG